MTQTGAPMVTVCSGDARRMFRPGRDVIVERDVRADLCIPDPVISRAHVILQCRDGQWVAMDNRSLNGMYVEAQRVRRYPCDGT
jgi:ABC transport system ATP-binding/permease protein